MIILPSGGKWYREWVLMVETDEAIVSAKWESDHAWLSAGIQQPQPSTTAEQNSIFRKRACGILETEARYHHPRKSAWVCEIVDTVFIQKMEAARFEQLRSDRLPYSEDADSLFFLIENPDVVSGDKPFHVADSGSATEMIRSAKITSNRWWHICRVLQSLEGSAAVLSFRPSPPLRMAA